MLRRPRKSVRGLCDARKKIVTFGADPIRLAADCWRYLYVLYSAEQYFGGQGAAASLPNTRQIGECTPCLNALSSSTQSGWGDPHGPGFGVKIGVPTSSRPACSVIGAIWTDQENGSSPAATSNANRRASLERIAPLGIAPLNWHCRKLTVASHYDAPAGFEAAFACVICTVESRPCPATTTGRPCIADPASRNV